MQTLAQQTQINLEGLLVVLVNTNMGKQFAEFLLQSAKDCLSSNETELAQAYLQNYNDLQKLANEQLGENL